MRQDKVEALGYRIISKTLNKHVDAEDKGTGAIRDSAYETRAIVINENDRQPTP